MRFVLAALAYIADPAHWSGAMGIGPLLVQHVLYSLAGVLIAALVGVPAGWWVGHTGRGRTWVQPLRGTARSLPTLGLITLFGLVLGVGLSAPMIAFVILALPSVLAGAMSGVRAASVMAVDGARASGMSELQVLGRVEIPLGAPLLVGGLRSASLQVISTATLAAYTGAGGLGRLMFLGLKTQDYVMMLSSALLVIALALASEAIFALIQWGVTPPVARQHRKESA